MKNENKKLVTVLVEAEVISRCGQAMERSGTVQPVGSFILEAALEKANFILNAHKAAQKQTA